MPFIQMDVQEEIEKRREESEDFRQEWDNSRNEYKLIGEMIALRKKQKISQNQLAALTGNRQQVISRIENKENSPTLKTFCKILN